MLDKERALATLMKTVTCRRHLTCLWMRINRRSGRGEYIIGSCVAGTVSIRHVASELVGRQHRRLDWIETAVHALRLMVIFFFRAIIAQ